MDERPDCYGIIPCRMASARFPGKPMARVKGKPLFWHVYTRSRQCALLKKVVLATADPEILTAAKALDVPVIFTKANHLCGTERVFEAAQTLGVADNDIVLNIQGDEATLTPDLLTELIACLTSPDVRIATLIHTIDKGQLKNQDVVKVIGDENDQAVCFFRRDLPPHLKASDKELWGHIGIYGFRMKALGQFCNLPPSASEKQERLEQLRFLDNNMSIHLVKSAIVTRSVNRPTDIPQVELFL